MNAGPERPQNPVDGELRRRAKDIMESRMSGEIDQMMRHFHDDVIVYYRCTKEGLFTPGRLIGKLDFRENIRRTDVDYEPREAELLDILVEGEKTAVRWRSIWRHRGTALIFTMDMAHFLRWKNGVVVEMYEFLDHHAVAGSGVVRMVSFEDMLTPRPPGLDRAEIERRAKELVSFPSNGPDVALIRKLCSPDIMCEFVGDRSRISYAGRHVGVDALINIVRTIAIDFEQFACAMSELIVDGGSVAGRRSVDWRHRGTGSSGRVDLAEFVRFEDGLIVELIEFRDSVTLLEMQGEMGPR